MAEKSENKLVCVIPGCRRTTTRFPQFREWVCGPHWSTIPKATRKRHQDLQRQVSHDDGLQLICRVELDRNWAACVEAAIQASAGL